jgi:hypothetical protein
MAFKDMLEPMVCLELTGGSFIEDDAYEEPLFLFYFNSVFFIRIDYKIVIFKLTIKFLKYITIAALVKAFLLYIIFFQSAYGLVNILIS